ncbi:MAG: hypothetical protein IPL26_30235 [Leptospiraceae bacterium]|nr:hypothetical protein [Leptospiraceae bacterium]
MKNFFQGQSSIEVIKGDGRRHLVQKSNTEIANKDLAQEKILEYGSKNALTHINTLRIIKDWQDSITEEEFLSKYSDDPEKLEIAKAVLELREG